MPSRPGKARTGRRAGIRWPIPHRSILVPFPDLRTNVMFCADERLLRGVFIRQHRLIPRHDWWSWLSSGRSTLAKIPDDQGRVILDRCGVYYVEPIEGV
jgi:hypothetical protein